MDRISDSLLSRYVNGVNLMPGTLRDQLGAQPVLLVFLRYFGCPFCKQTIADLRDVSGRVSGYPAVLFFHQGSPTEGRAFMRRYWPEARAIADPESHFYDGFGVGRGGFVEAFHPGSLPALVRAGLNGHFGGDGGSGDSQRMPGLFVARGAEVVWSHRAKHYADHPELSQIPRLAGILPAAKGVAAR